MLATDAHNLTEHCDWLSEVNQTEPRVTARPDAASCLFLYILPYGEAAPALILMFVFLTLFSLLVNGVTLFGLERSQDPSWEPRVAFFKNLVLSDLIQTVTLAPAIIHSLVRRRTMAFNNWCYVQYFVGTASIFSSLVTITCMALERYLYVCHAIHYLIILRQVRLRLALSLIWVYSISVGTISMVLLHTGEKQKHEEVTRGLLCEPDMIEQHMGFPRPAAIFRKVVGPFTLLLCLLVYAFSYLRMYQEARNAMIPFNAVNTAARKTVLFYCGMLFLQLLPLLFKVYSDTLLEFGGTTMAPQSEGVRRERPPPSAIVALLHMSLLALLLVPPCINPLVYGLRNTEMRRALLSPFRWLTERRG